MYGNYDVFIPPYNDEDSYLIENYQGDFDEDYGYSEDMSRDYSYVGQSLEDFLKDY